MKPWEMGIALDAEQRAMVDTAGRFAMEVMRPAGIALDKIEPGEVIDRNSVLRSVYRKYHELGFQSGDSR
jgi:hypothetical protein